MSSTKQPDHFVVDGSNIATEGRSMPSLEQLDDAVRAFMKQNPKVTITVVVDATFGHRIDKKERKAFDEAIANNELVAPPAGAVGRGDAFVLTIANQANAGVLSNDSFQEFHGEYGWLFDEGRLVGGKPVPNVGWIFVVRSPVRGPKSRQSIRESQNDSKGDPQEDKKRATSRVRRKDEEGSGTESSKSDSPKLKSSKSKSTKPAESANSSGDADGSGGSIDADDFVNDLMLFLDFVQHCPVGSRVEATIDSYSSHGAYAKADDLLIYIPLRYMSDPTPRSARHAVTIGDLVELIVVGFTPDRRSIDAALPTVAEAALADNDADVSISTKVTDVASAIGKSETQKPAKKTSVKRPPVKKSPAKAAAKKETAKSTSTRNAATDKSSTSKSKTTKPKTTKTQATKAKTTKTSTQQTKTRVHQLAKQLERSNSDIIAICEQLGLPVTSHASSLDAEAVALVLTAAGAK